MPDESSAERPDTRVRLAARAARSDSFARALGDEWVEVEPGIYRQEAPSVPDPPTGPVDQDERAPSLDQALRDALPTEQAEPEAPREPEPHSVPRGRSRWRRG